MKRDAILRTAARLFAERGFGNTPTILLAQEAGVAEGTIFRHFKTKDEIFFVLVDNVRNQLIDAIRKNLEARPPVSGMETVLAIVRAFCVFVRKNRMEFGLIFRDASSRYGDNDDQAFRSIRAMYEELGYLFYDAILQGQTDGSVGSALHPQDTASLLVCMLIGFMRGLHFDIIRQEGGGNAILPHLLTDISLMLSPAASAALESGPDDSSAV